MRESASEKALEFGELEWGYRARARTKTKIQNKSSRVSSGGGFTEANDMDIKNALNAILPINVRQKTGVDRSIKAGNTTDRDANGQAAYDQNQQQQQHPPMTEEQLEKALQHLRDFPAVKEHNLTVELMEQMGKRFVLLKEPDGKVIRRIPEEELWTLPIMSPTDPKPKGQLLRKTA